MSNSYSTIAANLASVAASAISTRLAVIAACTAFPLEIEKMPGQQRVVSLVKSVAATQISLTPDYTLGDAVIAPTQINHQLYTQVFGIDQNELNEGGRLEWLYLLNGQKLAATLSDKISSLLTVANFGAPIVTKSAANFAVSDFETLFSGVATEKRAIILDSPYFAKVKPPTWCPPNFNNTLEHTRWTAAGPNVVGFVADPSAIMLSYAMPTMISPFRNVMAESPLTIPQIGLRGTASIYFLVNSRRLMASLSIFMGAAVGDNNGLKLLTSV